MLFRSLPYTSCDSYYYDEGTAAIVLLSGIIYNRNELLDYLNLPDSNTTPELIYRLFSALGPHFVDRLNGDFAIFIGQPKKNQAFLFRDHIGIKPVFWRSDNSQLIFSSELNSICKIFSQGKIENIDYLMGYFKFIDYKNTTTKNVNRLLPGHWLEFTKNGTELKKYWHPELVTEDRNLEYMQIGRASCRERV
mgnify:CR=1 FL=1